MQPIKLFVTLLMVLFIAGKANSQFSVVIFSENGEKFTAYINGSKQNDKPANRVEANRPGGPSFKVRIAFEESSVPEISKSIFNSPGQDLFYVIKSSAKGKYVLEKTSSEYVSHKEKAAVEEKSGVKEEKAKSEEKKTESKTESSGGKGCSHPMEEPSFIASREMISNAPFDGPKLSQAKNLADKNCLTTSQIVELMYLFSGESSKLNLAKYAYKHCWDPKNYDKVKDVLRSSSKDDLQRYIDSQK